MVVVRNKEKWISRQATDIVHFLKLYRLSKDAHMNPRQIINLLQIANNDLQSVEHRFYSLYLYFLGLSLRNTSKAVQIC